MIMKTMTRFFLLLNSSKTALRHSELVSESPLSVEVAGQARNDVRMINRFFRYTLLFILMSGIIVAQEDAAILPEDAKTVNFQTDFTLLVDNAAQEAAIKEAETAYAQENYSHAIELYEKLFRDYGATWEIYYNLGNACYKAGRIAPAILNYERALLINPSDKDVRFNLEIAKLRKVDRIDPLEVFFLTHWSRSIQNLFSVDAWASIGIACFILFIACLALFFFSKWMKLKKTGFYAGFVLLFIVVCANVFAWNQKKAITDRKGAIIFAPTVTIKSSPDASGTDLVVLHEGTKVFIKSSLGEWFEIELEDGNVGWIRQRELEKI
jgi:tetratricopeptide (TPR) repeat protein